MGFSVSSTSIPSTLGKVNRIIARRVRQTLPSETSYHRATSWQSCRTPWCRYLPPTRIAHVLASAPAAIDELMRRDRVHLVHGILECVRIHALGRQNCIEDRPGNAGPGEREQMVVVTGLCAENNIGSSFPLLKLPRDPAVAAYAA